MFIGVARYEFFIPGSTSLKDKRRVLRSMSQAVRNKFNVSIAEVDGHDLWQRAAFGVSCVSGTTVQCRKILAEVEKTMSRSIIGSAEIVDRSIEVVSLEDL